MKLTVAVDHREILPVELRELLEARVSSMRMLPAVAQQAVELARDPGCLISEFTALVERDAKLASDVLSLANSAMYSPATPILNLHQAVVRIGFQQCQNLILSAGLTSLMRGLSLEQEWVQESLFHHSFLTGTLCVHLNRALNIGFHGEEFTGGLVHDIGRLLFAAAMPQRFSDIDPLNFMEANVLVHEEDVIGSNHCQAGVWFAQSNRLPEALIEVVEFHHDPLSAHSHRRLVALVGVCDEMANHLQRGLEPNSFDPRENNAARILAETGVVRAYQQFVEIAVDVMAAAVEEADGLAQQ